MPARRRAVLLCGQERATLAAIARELARAGRPLVIQSGRSDLKAAERLSRSLGDGTSARVLGADLGADAASRGLVSAAWKASGGLEAVVICPAIPAAAQSADPDRSRWNDGMSAALRGPFFLAKQASLRLGRAGGGLLVFGLVAPPDDAGPVAGVVHAGLRCLVTALAKAVPSGVTVAAVIDGRRRRGPEADADIARAVRLFVDAAPRSGAAILELGRTARRG